MPRAARAALRFAAVLVLVSLAACASRAPRPERGDRAERAPRPAATVPRTHAPAPRAERDGGPAIPPDVSRVPEPVPRSEPRARYGNKSPYTVLGRTYEVLPTSRGYVQRGLASWYGTKFHGRLTSSREPYDMYLMTAAHKTLPLPTFVRVTNLDNGRSIVVRVNDRGPFHEGRIIDLSYAAAIRLGVHIRGTAPVEVRTIEPGTRERRRPIAELVSPPPVREPARARAAPSVGNEPLIYQVGAFSEKANAKRLAARLDDAGIDDVSIDRERSNGRLVYRVRVGPVRARDADALGDRLSRMGLSAVPSAR